MKKITLGKTGITTPQNAFGALPIQRVSKEYAVKVLREAYEGGMTYFDTARSYSDSEEKLGEAFKNIPREKIYIATKTQAKIPEKFEEDLNTSLEKLQTDYIDVYQFHMADRCFKPGDGTGMYECMLKAKEEGKIRHIGLTAHKITVAEEAAACGLYETLQFPMSYLSSPRELDLIKLCDENQVGFVCMKALAGGLITRADAAMAFISQYDILPIWGIQKEEELKEWLSFMDRPVSMTPEISAFIEKEKKELSGEFCRGCGYCMPCPEGIQINNCARMSLMLRRAPSESWLTKEWQDKMKQIDNCRECRECSRKCPYGLDTPALLKENYEDYKKVLSGEVKVR